MKQSHINPFQIFTGRELYLIRKLLIKEISILQSCNCFCNEDKADFDILNSLLDKIIYNLDCFEK